VDAVDAKASKIRHSYLSMTRLLLARYSTCSLAASTLAASALFGPSWRQNRRVKLLYCGIDLAPFSSGIDAIAARSEFGFDVGNIVFGHVGRFDTQKNHAFVAEIAAEIAKREPTARFLLVGDGPLRSSIEHQFCRAGISGRTVFTGSRPDIPLLMKGVMDRLLFPSLYEGLGLVLIEAQAANLPAIVSDAVPTEAIIVPTLIRTLSLQESAATWANCALQHGQRLGSSPLSQIQRSPFNITQCLNSLIWLYYTERTYCNGAPSGR
jgi:glycosyltransferase involved in cell wall biosynthesis